MAEQEESLLAHYTLDDLQHDAKAIPADSDVSGPAEDIETRLPTEAEKRTLRRVADTIPASAFLIAIIELCERFAYYGMMGPFQNYMQNDYPNTDGIPGALGLGQQSATALSNFFMFWSYTTPILGAVIADQYLGRYKTILYFSIVYTFGLLVLFFTSLPFAIRAGTSLGGLITAMIVIGLGAGGIKSNVSPLIAEQYRESKERVIALKSGERVIIDPGITVQRIYLIFYLCINVGSLSAIPTTLLERHIGFWSAYLLPTCMFLVGFVIIVMGRETYVTVPPSGSVFLNAFKALWIALQNGGNLDYAKRSSRLQRISRFQIQWEDAFVEELKRTLAACKVFLFFPIYNMAYGQMMNNFISQAGTMALHGIPNDIMQNIDACSLIVLIPIMDHAIYPGLRRIGFPFHPITRIFCGFMFVALAMAYAAFVQHLIYTSPPHSVHVAIQAPAYLLVALSEIFAMVTGLEYAYTKAPASMKSFIMSVYLLTTAFGAALAGLISPLAVDPWLTWMYSGLCISCVATGVTFWVLFCRNDESKGSVDDPTTAAEEAPRGNHEYIELEGTFHNERARHT